MKKTYERLLEETGVAIHHKKKYKGKRSGQNYEVDLSFDFEKVGVAFLVLIECKYYAKKVGVDDVAEFAFKIDDIGAHKGVLVTTQGFQKGVFKIAVVQA